MCCYKLVNTKFEVWGLQTKVEDYVQTAIREILLLGHRQAFTWMDEWYNMTIEDVRNYEKDMQEKTNLKVITALENSQNNEETETCKSQAATPKTPNSPKTPSSASAESKSWFSWG
ncbi:unnamed protein product [Leptidea sinapis]|uniref:Phosphatidylinositol transfer protein N-terminal domain-containing protein n=2 Tax=Leptidea sinapis TaxID=189913 RepID=A0A5E4PX82_9NEOP|nr:unnamed protein product [Leptidea sinapis]